MEQEIRKVYNQVLRFASGRKDVVSAVVSTPDDDYPISVDGDGKDRWQPLSKLLASVNPVKITLLNKAREMVNVWDFPVDSEPGTPAGLSPELGGNLKEFYGFAEAFIKLILTATRQATESANKMNEQIVAGFSNLAAVSNDRVLLLEERLSEVVSERDDLSLRLIQSQNGEEGDGGELVGLLGQVISNGMAANAAAGGGTGTRRRSRRAAGGGGLDLRAFARTPQGQAMIRQIAASESDQAFLIAELTKAQAAGAGATATAPPPAE